MCAEQSSIYTNNLKESILPMRKTVKKKVMNSKAFTTTKPYRSTITSIQPPSSRET